MADVKWIKITTDIFDDEKVLLIETLPDAYAIITVWFKLLCLAGKQNNSGVFLMGRMPYTDKMLATIFRMKESTVTMALQTFEQFGMIEIIDGVITIPNWNKHQSLDAYEKKKQRDRLYQAERRAAQKALISGENKKSSDSHTTQSSYVAVSEEDIEEDKEKNKKIEKEKDIIDLFNTLCPSYSPVQVLSDDMRVNIRDSIKKYGIDKIKAVFSKAEASDFLKGSNGWSATFDWLIQSENIAKVLNGNYDNKTTKSYDSKEVEAEILKRMRQQQGEKVESDPVLMAEAEALKQELQEKYG